jgi:hypothetical protein
MSRTHLILDREVARFPPIHIGNNVSYLSTMISERLNFRFIATSSEILDKLRC